MHRERSGWFGTGAPNIYLQMARVKCIRHFGSSPPSIMYPSVKHAPCRCHSASPEHMDIRPRLARWHHGAKRDSNAMATSSTTLRATASTSSSGLGAKVGRTDAGAPSLPVPGPVKQVCMHGERAPQEHRLHALAEMGPQPAMGQTLACHPVCSWWLDTCEDRGL